MLESRPHGWVGVDPAIGDEGLEIIGRDPHVLPDLVESDATLLNKPTDEANRRPKLDGDILDGQQCGHADLLGGCGAAEVRDGAHQKRHHGAARAEEDAHHFLGWPSARR